MVRAAGTETHYSLLNFNGHFPTGTINMYTKHHAVFNFTVKASVEYQNRQQKRLLIKKSFFTLVTNGHNRQFLGFCSYPVTHKPPALDGDRVKASTSGSTLTQMRGDRLFASHCVNICRFYQPS